MTAHQWLSLVLGAVGTATGLASLIWHMVRARRDRCDLDLRVHRMSYLELTSERLQGVEIRDGNNPFLELAPPGLWVKFSGKIANRGLRDGSLVAISVLTPSIITQDGEGCFPDTPLAIRLDAGDTKDLDFRFHVAKEEGRAERLPDRLSCTVVLEDQRRRRYAFRLQADRGAPEVFGVTRRRH